MAFRGLYEHSLDSKDRLTVPSRFRAALSDGVVLSKGFDPCVWVHTTERVRAALRPLPLAAQPLRQATPAACAGASTAAPLTRSSTPPAGSAIPKPLIEHAGLAGPCVVVGAGEYLEIWNAEAWAKQEEELDADRARDRRGPRRAGARE